MQNLDAMIILTCSEVSKKFYTSNFCLMLPLLSTTAFKGWVHVFSRFIVGFNHTIIPPLHTGPEQTYLSLWSFSARKHKEGISQSKTGVNLEVAHFICLTEASH